MSQTIEPPKFLSVNGFRFPSEFSEEKVKSALAYEALPDDLFIVTYPKCGTTWTQQIITLLLNDGEIKDEDTLEGGLLARSPFLELQGSEAAKNMKRPGAIKTHFPFSLQPWNQTAKYIVVIRNPKDACVSFFHHSKLFPAFYTHIKNADIHDYLPYWLNGQMSYESYFDWYLSWWKNKDLSNVRFFVYEDMKTDLRKEVSAMAEFIGISDKLDDGLLDRVIANSTVDHMKKTTNVVLKKLIVEVEKLETVEDFNFIRKGIVGDWKNHFTEEEGKMFEEKTAEKFGGTGLDKLWDNYAI